MQTVSLGDSLHEMSIPIFWENKKKLKTSSADIFIKRAKSF